MSENSRGRGQTPKGVRGPSGPSGAGAPKPSRPPATGARATFERLSLPVLARMHSIPRWLVVILPAVLLFVGLLLRGSWAWLGGIVLLLVWAFLTWLTALSWPALESRSRFFRSLVVVGFGAIVVLKFMGRF